MPDDELFKRYFEIGASMLGMSRERAEGVVRDLVERGRAGTEELSELIRREIRQQVQALGLATKDDIARLEARLDELRPPAAPGKAAPEKATTKKAAKKATATRATATGDGAARPAGISRSASVRKRTAPPKG